MSRPTQETHLQTAAARARLPVRTEPYYRVISQGLTLGYRRGKRGGTWLARIRLPDTATYAESKLGRADDLNLLVDGTTTLTHDQAVRAAQDAFAHAEAKRTSGTLPGAGKKTIGDVLDLYIEGYVSGEARPREMPGRDLKNVTSIITCHLRPALGQVQLDRLNAGLLKAFKTGLAASAPLTRSGQPAKAKPTPEGAAVSVEDAKAERVRKRRARTNRIITTLRAALNYAVKKQILATDVAWRSALRAYGDVDAATIRYLTLSESKRLQAAVDDGFRKLIRGALLTGCRYGSLCSLKVYDVDLQARSANVRKTKNGKPHTIRLTKEGCVFMESTIKGKARHDFVFVKTSGDPWKPSDQQRRMQAGCKAAGIDPAIGFHGLRDTFASHLVMAGVPLLTVSKLLGHADIRTTEKYYAHLAPDYLHQAVDDHLPDF
ncbi:MAG: site-specific integrase [Beijerinckiaceae bacterium]|jgi:integrase